MGSFVENVNKIASLTPANVEDLNLIVQNIDAINQVAPLADDLNDIIDNIIPNLAEILDADNNAIIATEQALLATTNGSAQVALATTQAVIATEQATIATIQAGIATTKASEASTSATQALGYRNEAEGFRDEAEGYAESINPSILVHKDSDTGVAYLPSGTTAQRPTLAVGVKAIRYNTDLVSFEGWNGTSWGSIGGGAKGGSTDKVFFENDQVVTADYTITSGKNAMSAGTITINSGVTVTVPSGSTWVVL